MTPGRRSASALLVAPAAFAVGISAAGASSSAPPRLPNVMLANIGPGYAVVRQGPLDTAQFASSAPDPSATAAALSSHSGSVKTYERVWTDTGMHNEVQDLLVSLDSSGAAVAFLRGAQHAIAAGKVVDTGPVAGISGAVWTSYFASTTQVGVGQAITMRSGPSVVIVSMFSAAEGNPRPITETDALTIARAQHTAVVEAAAHRAPAQHPRSHGSAWWSALAGASAAVAALVLFAVYRNRYDGRSPVDRE